MSNARFATIALADDTMPYLVTLSCGYDAVRRRLVFHVAPTGRKLDIIARNPHACLSIIEDLGYKKGECAHPYRSVVMEGCLRLVEDADETRQAMRTLIGHLESEADSGNVYTRNNLDDDAALARFRMLVFDIESMSAKEGE